MPTYGYRCGSCGHEFEIQQRITAQPLAACPKCGGKLSKMLYPAGIIFKGSGYYTTDYKGSGDGSAGSSNGVAHKSEGSSDSKPETKTESKSESKSESKVEAKSEPKSESKSKSKSESKSGSTDKKGS
ncbi:MAG TPA: FmdB family zinc ribbon protein [Candidatus Acidoferrum sp.]|jgi:putative FmdB family regulatory protein|nr:FmdB family zinc ribbon protein [Candidatus Acidoferrum sp.]